MDDDRRSQRRWGGIVGAIGLAIAVAGFWLGATVGWDLQPSAAYVNHGLEAARGALAMIVFGAITTFVGLIVAFAPGSRR